MALDGKATFYDNDYIYSFFTDYFPQLPYELIIRILRSLHVRVVLQLQCLMKDKYIRSIKFKEINERAMFVTIPYTSKKLRYQQSLLEFQKMFDIIHLLIETNDDNKDNIIPISIFITTFNLESVHIINTLLEYPNNFDISLTIRRLDYHFQKQLLKLNIVNNVSELLIYTLTNDQLMDKTVTNLDLSMYHDLRSFRLANSINLSSIKFSTWYDTLVDLCITGVNVGVEFLRFKNLEDLKISKEPGKNIYIRHMPRSLRKLEIIVNENVPDIESGRCILTSFDDWPSNLENLILLDKSTDQVDFIFADIINFKLPSNLIELTIEGNRLYNMLHQLPDTLERLNLEYFDDEIDSALAENIIIPLGMKEIRLRGFNIAFADDIQFPLNLVHFTLNSCQSSTPLNDYNFEYSKQTLRTLEISDYGNPTAFTRLDFNEFSVLRSICFDYCEIVSLDNFIPPCCLEVLEISDNPITSINENCAVFNNPTKYPKLTDIQITYCEINYISPRIRLPINLTLFKICDTVPKDFYINSSIRNHEALEYIEVSMISKLDTYENEDYIDHPEAIIVNHKSKLTGIKFKMKWNSVYENPNEIEDLCTKVKSYIGVEVRGLINSDIVVIMSLNISID
ncbi:hypothetical protein DFJ63DRAFT_313256 [Scheffersomyces coipomensis]|uniref:uncharacterized protein n=1 Tax=Scheffersomyces coipomensis TaxID=1788519 RepID=UPI00315D4C9A